MFGDKQDIVVSSFVPL